MSIVRPSTSQCYAQDERLLEEATLRAFLEETLELWDVAGTVEPGEAPVVAIIRAGDGATVWIEQTVGPPRNGVESKIERPAFRWAVRWRGAGAAAGATRERRPRLCGSLVGVLSALREALVVDRGTPLRIAPAPRSA